MHESHSAATNDTYPCTRTKRLQRVKRLTAITFRASALRGLFKSRACIHGLKNGMISWQRRRKISPLISERGLPWQWQDSPTFPHHSHVLTAPGVVGHVYHILSTRSSSTTATMTSLVRDGIPSRSFVPLLLLPFVLADRSSSACSRSKDRLSIGIS